MRFELSPQLFNGWWGAVPPEDRDEFTHAYGGSLTQARFVCALEYLKAVAHVVDDLVVRSFALASDLDYEVCARDFSTRTKAQACYEAAPVGRLIEMLRFRSAREQEERIRIRTGNKLEELYTRAENEEDMDAKMRVEQMALTQSNMYLARASKERAAHENRKQGEAMRDAVLASKSREQDVLRPPSREQAVSFITQLAEAIGAAELRTIISELPHELNS